MHNATVKLIIFLSLLTFKVCYAEEELKVEKTEIETEENVLVLTEGNFEIALKENEFVLVEFYAPWCGHCKKLAPEYAKAATKLLEEGSKVKLAKVDATVEKNLASLYEVRGYPTLKFFREGKPSDYAGPREANGIVNWIEKKTGPPAVEVSDSEALKEFQEKEDVVVVGFFKKKDSDLAKEFVEAAKSIDDYKVLITSNAELVKGTPQDGQIVIFKKFDEPKVVFEGEAKSADIEKWVKESSVPLVWEFNQNNAQKIFKQPAKIHFLYFINVEDAQAQLKPLKKAASENKGKVVFVYVNTAEKTNEQVLKHFGLTENDAPMYTLFEMDTNEKYMSQRKTEAKEDEILGFVNGYFAGTLEQTLKSEEVPEDWDAENVKVLVGKNFEKVAYDKSKDVFVEFYAPWCGHCKKLAPVWDELAEEFADSNDVIIAKVDSTANEVKGVQIKSFPTLKMFKKGTNEVVDFTGARDLETLRHFVKTGEMMVPKKKEESEKDEL